MTPNWLTVKEYAAQMGVTDECVRVWLRRGYLVGRKTQPAPTRGGKGPWRIANPQPTVDSTKVYCHHGDTNAYSS